MNYQAISTLIETQGYKLDYIGTSYSRSLKPVINVGLAKDDESISFNLVCHTIKDFSEGIDGLSNFVGWLAQNDEKEEG